jgi:hypothetical protein
MLVIFVSVPPSLKQHHLPLNVGWDLRAQLSADRCVQEAIGLLHETEEVCHAVDHLEGSHDREGVDFQALITSLCRWLMSQHTVADETDTVHDKPKYGG